MILRPIDADTFVEESMPVELEDDSVTILFARGSTHLAATRTIQELLPVAKTARNAVVIARLRGAEQIGSTFITVLERYATELRANGGRLMLSGVHPKVKDQ
jgi:SulP family sulfate permease